MGHMIRAIIAKKNVIQNISDHWAYGEKIVLPQGYGMSFLNDSLFDDIEELFDIADTHKCPQFNYLSDSVISFLLQESKDAQIIYIETDYFGGYGTQTGVLFENGSIAIEPRQGNGVINYLLHQIGVYKEHNKDEFTSLQLYRFRRMD